ncbi:hypothetical protein [Hydrogenimonas cancrithermarum]|uniref:Uncharacterized protein n=1 Tax=Hydrogenimonas cancrithermarum TaxID=2993563 RepID=A0ABN6WY14_9BACT|nr:hypothetical protein [Hydrogenimonas cancrithermarum]BDY13651.1 hypothetical protein HCR_19630 [Hydrogenimonas cancrithermarum]
MFNKKIVYFLMFVFAFLSISALIVNMPEKKDAQVIEKLAPYFPYEITKTIGGLDLIDKRSGEKLKLDNAKVFLAYDDYLKKWGKTHLKIEGNRLVILDDSGTPVDSMELTPNQRSFIQKFFFQQ